MTSSPKLGHPLSRTEEESLLREFGHPVLVAGRYRPQQYLIGPELYPLYGFVLKLVLTIIGGVALIIGVVGTAASIGSPGAAAGLAVRIAWNGTLSAIGGITLICAVLQRYSKQLGLWSNWPHDPPGLKDAARGVNRFSNRVGGIVANAFFILVWIRLAPAATALRVGQGQGLHLSLAPIWHTLYLPVLAVSACAIAVDVIRLTRTGRGRPGYALDLALQVILLIVLARALHAGHWILVNGIAVPAQAIANADRGLNLTLQWSLLVVGCVALIRAGYDAWRLFHSDQATSR